MRAVVAWSDRVPDRDGQSNTVWDMVFRPDGMQLIVAVGNRVLVYDAMDGDLLHSLKGHKDTVYCVDYSRDGKRFASGGADKTIIIWTSKAEGILKYSHNDTIQKLVYNPVTAQLASCTASDFGLWSPEQKSVQKHKVPSKILCAAWTLDGQFIALGLLDGHVTVRDRHGVEKVAIVRDAPVWCMAWSPNNDSYDVLALGCWDQTLSFYQLSGLQHGKDRRLDFDPCTLSYFSNGEYLVVGGSDKTATLMTKEGIKLTTIAEREDWVWCARARPKQNYVAVGCNAGTIAVYQLIFSTVHGLYQERYAYRDTMTDVIVQHLMTEQRVRIRCKNYVKKIAVYRDRLAVQLPEVVIVYELAQEDPQDMHYRVRKRIHEKLECNLLVVTSLHVILCQERKLQLYNFDGVKEREWVLESVIRYIKVVGGPSGREGLLVGLKSGTVLKIFVDNPFPISLIKQRTSIRCLDLSASRNKLAVVDENATCLVYDLTTKDLLFQESNANSVAWNTEMEDMLCFSGNGQLCIKTGEFPVHKQKMQGFVVGFNGSKVFCLHYVAMQTIDVPQSASMYRYIGIKDWDTAYKVACLGVTDSDWRVLALAALKVMNLDIARRAFIRVRDMRYIDLINSIEQARKQQAGGGGGAADDRPFLAEIMAYQGAYAEAAKIHARAGQPEKAIAMFSDLRMWDQAMGVAKSSGSSDVQRLVLEQADWVAGLGDHRDAAARYLAAGKYMKAAQITGERGWLKEMMEVARAVDKDNTEVLRACAGYCRAEGNHKFAKEIYIKMDDVQALMELHVELHHWEEAFLLAKAHPGRFSDDVFLPYAEWLAINDRFEEAQAAYKQAGRPDLSRKILQQLTHNAVVEQRYKDAGYFYWLLAQENLKMVSDGAGAGTGGGGELSEVDHQYLARFHEYGFKAEMYYAYHSIYQYVDEPFTSMMPESLFNVARFLMNSITAEQPFRISRVYILYTLAKQGKALEAYKLARFAFEKLWELKLPRAWTDQIDLAVMTIQSKPYSDREDLLPACYRCSSTNPLVTSTPIGDVCIDCGHPFIRSFASFDCLPLVQFFPAEGISDEEAIALAKQDSGRAAGSGAGGGSKEREDNWREHDHGGDIQTMTFGGDDDDAAGGGGGKLDEDADLFAALLTSMETTGDAGGLIVADRDVLRQLVPSEVYVQRFGHSCERARFFKNMIPDVPISLCQVCNKFFHQEDFEFSVLQKGQCPFCRSPAEKVGLL